MPCWSVVGEAVAIISVSASALVGVGGLAIAAWGGSRERRWQSREERAIELRAVLEDGGSQLAGLLLKVDEAHDEVQRLKLLGPDRKADLEATEKSVVLAISRVGVRRGSRAPEYRTFGSYWLAISKLGTILAEADGEGLDSEQQTAYSRSWTEALAAQDAYLDATANAIGWEEPLPRWRRVPAWFRASLGGKNDPKRDSTGP
jgi:hypothetical protein